MKSSVIDSLPGRILLGVIVFFSSTGAHADALLGAELGTLGGALAASMSGPWKNRQENALIGGAVGAALGYALGNEIEKAAYGHTVRVLDSEPSYSVSQWYDPDTGVTLSAEPRPMFTEYGSTCREVVVRGRIDGREEAMLGKACRREDGRWYVVDRQVFAQPEVIYYQSPAPRVIYRTEPVVVIQPRWGHSRGYRDWRDDHHRPHHRSHHRHHSRHR